MGSFEWMELQALTADITSARSRLAEARADKDPHLARQLEAEIIAAENRRTRLLTNITTLLSNNPEQPAADQIASAAGEGPLEETVGEEPALLLTNRIGDSDAMSLAGSPPADSVQGDSIVWDQLTPGDIERARNELGERREEMLARHAAELKALDDDQNQIEALQQAIAAFVRKFDPAGVAASVIDLGQVRAAV